MNAKTLNARYDTVAKFLSAALACLLAFHSLHFAFTLWTVLKIAGLVVLFRFVFDLLKPALLRPLLQKEQS